MYKDAHNVGYPFVAKHEQRIFALKGLPFTTDFLNGAADMLQFTYFGPTSGVDRFSGFSD